MRPFQNDRNGLWLSRAGGRRTNKDALLQHFCLDRGEPIQRAKLTQKAVAGILKVSRFSIINWERGEFQPSEVATLHRIIEFLRYHPLPVGQTIPERLRQQRRLMGWCQRELAEHFGVDRCTVTGWELDGTILKRSHRSMVARFLGLAEADLICEMGDRWNKNHGKRSVHSYFAFGYPEAPGTAGARRLQ